MPQVRAIVASAQASDYRLIDLVMGIVNSDSFRYQALEPDAGHDGDSGAKSAVKVAALSVAQ